MTLQDLAFPPTVQSDLAALTPRVQVEKPEATPAINVNILALDLGARTGWALRHRSGRIIHGTEIFVPRANWNGGQKWQRFRAWLSERIMGGQVDQIAYEDVKRHIGTDAAHAYGGYLAMLEMVAAQHNVPLVPFGVSQIKQHWTGAGNAKKDQMIAEAKRRGFRPDSDNSADALAILHIAIAKETGAWKPTSKRPRPKSKANGMRRPAARDLFGAK